MCFTFHQINIKFSNNDAVFAFNFNIINDFGSGSLQYLSKFINMPFRMPINNTNEECFICAGGNFIP